ncbi:protein PET100 homolog, mitochondrial isoform X2 [Nematostella vectensis]|uniref:protein PET100 homolog, mitochondrial isoform X2 n=1 Tax=Nematostella vectensis TaxID=45351 RepID=UPI00138FA9E1|nr:protein PET100 homolog, mitochondrial isoform X2 [Nematostella vectensis]
MATGSKIELFRIAVYVFFPVALFYYFNLPEIYEDYVNNKKGQIYPPDETTHKPPTTIDDIKAARDIMMERKRKEKGQAE